MRAYLNSITRVVIHVLDTFMGSSRINHKPYNDIHKERLTALPLFKTSTEKGKNP